MRGLADPVSPAVELFELPDPFEEVKGG